MKRQIIRLGEVEKAVQQDIDGIKEDKSIPQRVIQLYFDHLLYGSQLYARPVGGTEVTPEFY